MCDCEKKQHSHHHGHGHNNHYDRHHRRYLNVVPGSVDLKEVSVIKGRELPGVPAAKLARSLGYNSARRSGQQYAYRSTGFSLAYGYYT